MQMGVDAADLSAWHCAGEQLNCSWQDPGFKACLLSHLRATLMSQRFQRIADTFDSPSLSTGLDWTSHRLLLKKKTAQKRTATTLKAVWQGAILHNATGGLKPARFVRCLLLGGTFFWNATFGNPDTVQSLRTGRQLAQDSLTPVSGNVVWSLPNGLLPAGLKPTVLKNAPACGQPNRLSELMA